ncbi:hypothetical protein D3C85_1156390 [compost metagenome]
MLDKARVTGVDRLDHQVEQVVAQLGIEHVAGLGCVCAFRFPPARMRQHHGITALVIDQRRAAVIFKLLHLADHDPVVASIHMLVVGTLEIARTIVELRCAAEATVVFDAVEFVCLGPGEMIGQGNLVRSQDVDCEVTGCLEYFPGAGAFVQAPEN